MRDVAIRDGRIAAVARDIPAAQARKVVNVAGLYVTPGPHRSPRPRLFRDRTESCSPAAHTSIFPDDFALRVGVTTVVDAGSSGRHNFAEFKKNVIDRARTRVLVFLNIGGAGMPGDAEEQNVADMDAKAAAELAIANRDTIVGIKVAHYRGPDWTPVERGVEAGTLANIPVMIDFGEFRPERPFQDLVLKKLRPGDIYTHAFYVPVPMLDDKGRLLPYLVRSAQARHHVRRRPRRRRVRIPPGGSRGEAGISAGFDLDRCSLRQHQCRHEGPAQRHVEVPQHGDAAR